MIKRTDMTFQTTDGLRLAAWLYRPTPTSKPCPMIVMSHGTGCVKEMGLEPYAEAFAAAGYACLVYDHRNLGASEGEPRAEIDPWQQVSDLKDAITFASSLDGIDATRLGIWGTSYAGGHVIVVGATDRRVNCVVAQVPTLSGYQTTVLGLSPAQIDALVKSFAADRLARLRGEAPARLPPAPPGTETGDWLKAAGSGTRYRGDQTLRSKELRMGYEPADYISRIAPTPFLMVGVTRDSRSPPREQQDGFSRAREPKKLVLIDGGHYAIYGDKRGEAIEAALDWFRTHTPA